MIEYLKTLTLVLLIAGDTRELRRNGLVLTTDAGMSTFVRIVFTVIAYGPPLYHAIQLIDALRPAAHI